jgi:TolB-like protein/tetratricopeptide (TPR) repeat protein
MGSIHESRTDGDSVVSPETGRSPEQPGATVHTRLDSWKEIAVYLRRDVRTVQAWEKKEGLPVHRHTHSARASVYAYAGELDAWLKDRRVTSPEPAAPVVSPPRRRSMPLLLSAGAAVAGGLVVLGLAVWARSHRLAVVRQPTLAVLPFESLSADSNDALVADGLTDDIITELGRSSQIAVISRRSVAQFKGTHMPLQQVARMLNANLVLEGTIAHAGKTVRITAQLIDAGTDHHLWAESYERDSVNVLSLQDEVTGAVSTAILEKLTGHGMPAERAVRLVDPDVRLAFLTGRFFMAKRDEPGLTRAVVYFRQALRGDSTYGPAYAGLADCYNLLGTFGFLPEKQAFPAARAAALRAIRLDSTSAEAYNSLAFETYRYDWDFASAEKNFKYAVRLNPSYATAHQWFGEFLGDLRRTDEAITESRRAVELDPLSAIARSDLGLVYLHVGHYAEASAELHHVLALYPDFALAHSYLGGVYIETGHLDQARVEEGRAVPAIDDGLAIEDAWAAGKTDEVRARTDVLTRRANAGHYSFITLAHLHARLGDYAAAQAALERSFQQHEWMLVTLKVDPYFAHMRDDPRFRDLIRRIGIP